MTKFGDKLGYSFKNINIVIYFENLTVELHIFYTLNTNVKFVPIRCYLLYDS